MAKWIKFELVGLKPKTNVWEVQSIDGDTVLGIVQWHRPWRRYCFFPETGTVFEEECLDHIRDFIMLKTRVHKEERHG